MQTLKGGKKLTVKQGLSAENKRHKAQKKQQGRVFSSLLLCNFYLDRQRLTLVAITFSCRCIRQKL